MANLALGIDTGGTFTDGVLFDLDRKEILAKSKVLTSRPDLTPAIEACLAHLMESCSGKGRAPALGAGAAEPAFLIASLTTYTAS